MKSQLKQQQENISVSHSELQFVKEGSSVEVQNALANHRKIVERLKKEIQELKHSVETEKIKYQMQMDTKEDDQKDIIKLKAKLAQYERSDCD